MKVFKSLQDKRSAIAILQELNRCICSVDPISPAIVVLATTVRRVYESSKAAGAGVLLVSGGVLGGLLGTDVVASPAQVHDNKSSPHDFGMSDDWFEWPLQCSNNNCCRSDCQEGTARKEVVLASTPAAEGSVQLHRHSSELNSFHARF